MPMSIATTPDAAGQGRNTAVPQNLADTVRLVVPTPPRHDPGGEPTAHTRVNYVADLRKRADRVRLGLLPAQRRGSSVGITQEEMAELLGITVTWYSKLERSEPDARWNETLVARITQILSLTDIQRQALYHQTLGWIPRPATVYDGVNKANLTFINGLSSPAFLVDETWRIRYCNAEVATWTCLTPGINLMSWVLADPQARECLIAWETSWATPMLAQLRTTWMLSTGTAKATLAHTIDRARQASPDIERLWHADPTLHDRPSGEDIRRIHVPGRGTTTFSLWSGHPTGSDWRLVSFAEVGKTPDTPRAAS
jgi:DNA-binding XRE family transcriptional regulator